MQTDWADVYRQMYQDVVRFLYRKVWDADRAHDLAQETFVRCLRQEPDNPRALIFTVAANLARDEARTVLRRKKHLTLIRVEPQPEPASPAENAERTAQVESVQAALATLGDRDREVLLLWDAGMSYDEIAAQTGLAVGAIGTTLARARRRLVAAHEALEGQKHAAR
ncbi:MAG TPA: sigma-70 family RNA polymerase sigma factor [Longimicrobiales bacterium]|nr:sigma-70 family RNA polymerase sigma factor [Longimicrobiales bacterium]